MENKDDALVLCSPYWFSVTLNGCLVLFPVFQTWIFDILDIIEVSSGLCLCLFSRFSN